MPGDLLSTRDHLRSRFPANRALAVCRQCPRVTGSSSSSNRTPLTSIALPTWVTLRPVKKGHKLAVFGDLLSRRGRPPEQDLDLLGLHVVSGISFGLRRVSVLASGRPGASSCCSRRYVDGHSAGSAGIYDALLSVAARAFRAFARAPVGSGSPSLGRQASPGRASP